MAVSARPPRGVPPSSGAAPGRTHLRLALVVVLILGLAVPLLSSLFGLYDDVTNWGKLVHAVDGWCAALLFGFLLLGWRQQAEVDLPDELAGLMTVFAGIFFGVMWEIVEFIRDWVAYSDLQKSNTDTMTDFLCNDVAAVLAALLAVRIYTRWLNQHQRQDLGRTAEWLVDGPSRVLDRHGFALTIVAVVLIGAAVTTLWFTGRPVPGFPLS